MTEKLFSLLVLVYFSTVYSQPDILYLLGDQAKLPLENSLLWKIEGPGVSKNCYLFGTMHLIEKEFFLFPEKLKKTLEKSDVLLMELAGIPPQAEIMDLIKLKEGNFFEFFNAEQTDSIVEWAKKKLLMNEATFRNTVYSLKPFVVVQMATQIQFMGRTESYEMTFEKLALEKQMRIEGLETVQEQISYFDALSNQIQQEMVMEAVRHPEESILETRKMEEMYNRQNIDSLYLLIKDEGGFTAEEENNFIDKRNQKWIPLIERSILSNKTFIAVGAGHLGGPNGLVRLLRKKGYTLTPYSIKG